MITNELLGLRLLEEYNKIYTQSASVFTFSISEENINKLKEQQHEILGFLSESHNYLISQKINLDNIYSLYSINKTTTGYVYFIKNNDNNLFKIGLTNDLNKRIKEISKAFMFCGYNPAQLQYYGVICCNECIDKKKLEMYLHSFFASRRCNGEWFDIKEKDIDNFLASEFKIIENIFVINNKSYEFKVAIPGNNTLTNISSKIDIFEYISDQNNWSINKMLDAAWLLFVEGSICNQLIRGRCTNNKINWLLEDLLQEIEMDKVFRNVNKYKNTDNSYIIRLCEEIFNENAQSFIKYSLSVA